MKFLLAISALILFSNIYAAEPLPAPPSVACVQTGGILKIITLDNIEYKTQCCSGLEIEMHGSDEVCFKKEDSPLDPTLQACTATNQCSTGQGCFVQHTDDLFSGETNSDAEEASQNQAQDAMDVKIETVLGEEGDPKVNGASCTYHAECESYSCEASKVGDSYKKTCTEKKICRLAQEEEVAEGSVQCEEELYKDSANVCKSKQDGTYLGLIGDIEIQNEGQCKMSIPENAQYAGQSAMKALRSMEYLFANITDSGVTDCLMFIKPVLRDQIGKVLFEQRKEIVKEFNEGWALIKQDYKTIMAAQAVDASSTTMVTLHDLNGNPVQVQDGVIKSRTASGLDMLVMMKRRNLLFKTYEDKMKLAVQSAFNDVKALEASMINSFNQNSKQWTVGWDVGSKHYEKGDVSCKSGFLGFGKGKRKKVKKRYGKYFRVSGSQSRPLEEKTLLINSLAQMAGGSVATAKNDLTRGSYWLLDPLIPAGVNAGISSGWLSTGSLVALRNDLPKGLINYLKKFNPENKPEFLYEPELVSITDGEVDKAEELATCLNSTAALADPKCAKLNSFVQEMSDVTTAQIFAFSRKGSKNYKNYFHNVNSWRRRLLNYYSVNYANLVSYYTALNNYREQQNECIDQQLGLIKGGMVSAGGYTAGEATDYWTPANYSGQLNTSSPAATATAGGSLSVNHNFSGFNGATNTVVNSGTLKDNMASGAGSSTGGANVSSTANGTFAANIKKMNSENAKNMSATELAAKSKDVMASITSIAKSGGASTGKSAFLGGSSLGGSSAMGNLNNAAGVNSSASGTGSGADGDGSGAKKTSSTGSGSSASGNGFSGLGGISAGSNGGLSTSDVSGANVGDGSYQDPTGMSDEEKDRLMANYERTKSKYSPNENDSLFNVVSKAYVRNLDKVLTKKKKNLEAQESK